MSYVMASLADALTRESTTWPVERALLERLGAHGPEGAIWEWLLDLRPDWTLGGRVVNQIKNMLNK